MIACTIIIILTLVRSSTRSGSTSVRRSRRRRNISVMLITINLVFISLTAPIVIFLSMYPHLKEEQNKLSSINIIIYSVTAKEFRSETKNFLHALLYCCIGKPTSPIEFAHSHHDGTFISRLTRLRINLFKCCRVKINSNSTNTTDSSGLPHTATAGTNKISSKNEYR
ncbi:unnamed protein product, partial [Rotaria magnacalcarata]